MIQRTDEYVYYTSAEDSLSHVPMFFLYFCPFYRRDITDELPDHYYTISRTDRIEWRLCGPRDKFNRGLNDAATMSTEKKDQNTNR